MTKQKTVGRRGRPSRRSTRRRFLKDAGALFSFPAVISAASLGRAAGQMPAGDRLTMGFIGLGSMGMRHIKGFLTEHDCRITAVCDVDAARRKAAVKEVNTHYKDTGCRQFHDFRAIVDLKGLDTLCIAVPDHWHSAVAIAGVRAGKDIYGEKPLALTIEQGKDMVRAVNRYACIWQTGSWQRSTAHFRKACELVRNKRIGKLKRVEVGIGGGKGIEPQPVMPVPDGFDYNMWLGPAPWRPYTEKRCHWNFRWNLDYSGGQVTDWGAHHIDIAHWGMGVDDTGPLTVEGTGEFPPGLWNTAVTYDFKCTYANGVDLFVGSNNYYKQGVRWIGDSGWVHVTRGGLKAHPETLLKETIGPDEIHLKKPPGDHRQGHRVDFLQCVRTRREPITPVEIGHRSITVAHLGNIAMLTGRKIRWDPKREIILGDPTAAGMCERPMRAPWR